MHISIMRHNYYSTKLVATDQEITELNRNNCPCRPHITTSVQLTKYTAAVISSTKPSVARVPSRTTEDFDAFPSFMSLNVSNTVCMIGRQNAYTVHQ